MLDKLGDSLKRTLRKITTSFSADKELIESAVKEIQRALIVSDVNVKLVFELSKRIKTRAMEEKPKAGISRKEQLVTIIYEELTRYLGLDEKLEINKTPYFIMLIGLFGNGKTTTSVKLGYYLKKKGYKVALLQTDTYRPAAYEQMKQNADKVHIDAFGDPSEKNALKIYDKFKKELKKYDVIIVDTAGRDALSEDLIDELDHLKAKINPNSVFLVMGADVGQGAEKQAKAFKEVADIDGVIITKMDGSAKGGGALSACKLANAPVYFIGTGEKIEEFEEFDVKKFVSRLIGFGDLETLLDKLKEEFTEEDAKDIEKRFKEGKINLLDVYNQLKTIKKFGSLKKIINLIPGLSSLPISNEMLQSQEGMLKYWEVAINSFTVEELENPDIINDSRIERVARGSGISKDKVAELIQGYKKMKKTMKMFGGNKGKMNALMKKYKKMGIDLDNIDLGSLPPM